MDLDIVILPPTEVSQKIGQSVLALHKQIPLSMAVDNKKLFPHVSLLHLKAAISKTAKIIESVGKLAKRHRRFGVVFTEPYGASRFFVIKVRKNNPLYALHREAVEDISGYRAGKTNLPKVAKSKLQEAYMRKYGVGNVLKYFVPHITLGHPKKTRDISKILSLVGKMKFQNFYAQRLAVTKVNQHHQVVKIIKEFKLKN